MSEVPLFRRRNLPHWDVPGATYFVTACLEGSIPARGLLDLARYRYELDARERPPDLTEEEWDLRRSKLEFARLDEWLDREPAVRWLERAELAQLVIDSLLHFADVRYDVLALAVMPSHFHWVFRPRDEWVATIPVNQRYRSAREQVMHSVKGYSAGRCNRILGRDGPFWQSESYDHWIRDMAELERIIAYVENNPVKAGFVKEPGDWVYSSASLRKVVRLPNGYPVRGGRSPGLPE